MTVAKQTPRKGARTRAGIPPDILAQLNRGELESASLVEWLAIDVVELATTVAYEFGIHDWVEAEQDSLAMLNGLGIMDKTRALGAMWRTWFASHPRKDALRKRLQEHRSDSVRAWAAFGFAADESLSAKQRLEAALPFAADSHMGVRECAWMAYRPVLIGDLDVRVKQLQKFVTHDDANIRRFVSECSRPRGVWCAHIDALKKRPERALGLLEPLRADPSRYVQNSVANWLNDASKTRSEWVVEVCERWAAESKTKQTAYIVNRALRTLRKKETK